MRGCLSCRLAELAGDEDATLITPKSGLPYKVRSKMRLMVMLKLRFAALLCQVQCIALAIWLLQAWPVIHTTLMEAGLKTIEPAEVRGPCVQSTVFDI